MGVIANIEELRIGDSVYETDGVRIYKSMIQSIDEIVRVKVYNTETSSFDASAIGIGIFLTKQDAERKMKTTA